MLTAIHTKRLIALATFAALAASAGLAAETAMTVTAGRTFLNQNSTEWNASTVATINTLDEGHIQLQASRYGVADFSDPHPSEIPAGSTIDSVIVTAQFRTQTNPPWSGQLILAAYDGATVLGSVTLATSTQATTKTDTLDITDAVNGRANPLTALNNLQVRMTNDSGQSAFWVYARVDVVFTLPDVGDPPDTPSIATPGSDGATVARDSTVAASEFGPGDQTHVATEWAVYSDSGLTSRIAYALRTTSPLDSIATVSAQITFQGSHAGRSMLAPGTNYWVVVRYRNSNLLWSEWSEKRHVVTAANQPPAAPSVSDPGATDVARNVTLAGSSYSDPEGDAHSASEWEIEAYEVDTWALVGRAEALTTLTATSDFVDFEGSHAGKLMLAPSTDYRVRLRYMDAEDGWSDWSGWREFETMANTPPETPVITSPTGSEVSRNPTIAASAFADADGDLHLNSDWLVYDSDPLVGSPSPVAFAMASTSRTSIAVGTANMTFAGSLEGEASLAANTTYWAVVIYRDGEGATSQSLPVSFVTSDDGPPNVPSVTDPGAADLPRTPSFVSSAYAHTDSVPWGKTEWEIFSDSGLTSRVALAVQAPPETPEFTAEVTVSGATATFFGALIGRNSLNPGTDYWARVVHFDENGGSAASAAVQFRTEANKAPLQPQIVEPDFGEDGVSRNPIIVGSAYSDPDYDGHRRSHWEIYDGDTPVEASRVARSENNAVDLTEIVFVAGPRVVFENNLAGQTSLDAGTPYWVRVRYQDNLFAWSEWSSMRAFETTTAEDEGGPPDPSGPVGEAWPYYGEGCGVPAEPRAALALALLAMAAAAASRTRRLN